MTLYEQTVIKYFKLAKYQGYPKGDPPYDLVKGTRSEDKLALEGGVLPHIVLSYAKLKCTPLTYSLPPTGLHSVEGGRAPCP